MITSSAGLRSLEEKSQPAPDQGTSQQEGTPAPGVQGLRALLKGDQDLGKW